MKRKKEVEVLARSTRGHAKEETAYQHMERAFLKHFANIGEVWQDNLDEGRWHWYVGYDPNDEEMERSAR